MWVLLCLISLATAQCVASSCSSCTSQKALFLGCRWCPSSQSCHVVGSPLNPCNRNRSGSVSQAGQCPPAPNRRSDYDAVRAGFLMRLSNAAYDNLFLLSRLSLPSSVEVSSHYSLPFSIGQSLVSFLGVDHSLRRVVLVVRGTPGISLQLLQQLIDTGPDVFPGESGVTLVNYFRDAGLRLFAAVEKDLSALIAKNPSYGVSVTGHSLGGALAEVLAVKASLSMPLTDLEVYTFGSPRVGNAVWASLVGHFRYYRIVHNADPIPHFPNRDVASWAPVHAQTEIFYPASSKCQEYSECVGREDVLCSARFLYPKLLASVADHEPAKYMALFACTK